MADISKITLPSGTTYDIKDSVARAAIGGAIIIKGTTTTALTDESTVNPIVIDGESYTAVTNDAVFYGNKEFVFDGNKWHEFGDMTGLGDLATKNNASGSYTPTGTVSAPTINLASAGSTTTITPIATVGTLPSLTTTVANETLTIGFSQGTLPTKGDDVTVKTGDATYSATQPTFNGTTATITVS